MNDSATLKYAIETFNSFRNCGQFNNDELLIIEWFLQELFDTDVENGESMSDYLNTSNYVSKEQKKRAN